MNVEKKIEGHLIFVYGAEKTPQILKQIQARLKNFTEQYADLLTPVPVVAAVDGELRQARLVAHFSREGASRLMR